MAEVPEASEVEASEVGVSAAPDDYKALVRQAITQGPPSFARATFTGRGRGPAPPWVRVVLRPVLLKGQAHVQFAYYDEKKCITKNHAPSGLAAPLAALLEMPFRNIHVSAPSGDLQVNLTKDGRPLVHRTRPALPAAPPDLAHNRQKDLLLPEGTPDAFLQAIGFMTEDGRIRADKQKKFRQINEFLRLLQQTGELEKPAEAPLEVVDFGCGNAYLTFAVYHYLNHIRHAPARVTGVDLQGELLDKHAETVAALGWDGFRFERSAIAGYAPPAPPDITLALHACDTATDDALAQGIRWGSRLIVSVPCCHHHLQAQLGAASAPEEFRPVSRHGILAERMGDLLTDAFRALILRIMGYQTDVMQFISAEHTAKNVMIRAVRSDSAVPPHFAREYAAMKDYWRVTPYLETLLGGALEERLAGTCPSKPPA